MAKTNALNKKSIIGRSAREIKKYRVLMKLLPAIAGLLAAVIALTFLVSIMFRTYGSFTVSVSRAMYMKYGLSLAPQPDMSGATSVLDAQASEEITNIDGNLTLPLNLNTVNGSHNGTNYLAYTFFLKNAGTETVDVMYNMTITNITMDIDEACRIRLYSGKYDPSKENTTDEYVDYAKTKSDGSGPEDGTTEFLSQNVVTNGEILDMEPGDIYRYTIVIWLEGPDVDCTDDKIGGQFKVDMDFGIIGMDEEESEEE